MRAKMRVRARGIKLFRPRIKRGESCAEEEKCRGGSASGEFPDKRPERRGWRSSSSSSARRRRKRRRKMSGGGRQACEPINNLWFISARYAGARAERGRE